MESPRLTGSVEHDAPHEPLRSELVAVLWRRRPDILAPKGEVVRTSVPHLEHSEMGPQVVVELVAPRRPQRTPSITRT